jgi:hypothetical protein
MRDSCRSLFPPEQEQRMTTCKVGYFKQAIAEVDAILFYSLAF